MIPWWIFLTSIWCVEVFVFQNLQIVNIYHQKSLEIHIKKLIITALISLIKMMKNQLGRRMLSMKNINVVLLIVVLWDISITFTFHWYFTSNYLVNISSCDIPLSNQVRSVILSILKYWLLTRLPINQKIIIEVSRTKMIHMVI